MQQRSTPLIAMAFTLVVVACSSASTGELASGSTVELPIAEILAYEYDVVSDPLAFAARSDLIVVGTIQAIEHAAYQEGETYEDNGSLVEEGRTETVALVVEVEKSFKGPVAPGDLIRIGWDAFTVDSNGNRLEEWSMNGVRVPKIGKTYMWILREPEDYEADFFEQANVTHRIINFDSVLLVNPAGRIVPVLQDPQRLSAQFAGRTVQEVVKMLGVDG
ncbi:MAG: hypothetical protein ACE5F5_08380 [Acidimicrobiia bacterium]